eukprot:RCo015548
MPHASHRVPLPVEGWESASATMSGPRLPAEGPSMVLESSTVPISGRYLQVSMDVSPVPALPRPPKRQCGVPLFVSLILPAVVVAIVFMVGMWQTTSATTLHSADSIASRVFDVVQLQLSAQISLLTQGLASTVQMGAAAVLMDSNVDSLQRYFYRVLDQIDSPLEIRYTTTTGLSVSAVRYDGQVLVRLFDPGPNGTRINGSEPLLLSWTVDSQLEKLKLIAAFPYSPLSRPWYTAVASRNFSAAFSPVYQLSTQKTFAISLGVPVDTPGGELLGIVTSSYDLRTIHEALHSAHEALDTSGMLVLLDENGSLISSSMDHYPNDILETIRILPTFPSTSNGVLRASFAPFGPCFVVQTAISGQVRPDFFAYGLDWRLFVI